MTMKRVLPAVALVAGTLAMSTPAQADPTVPAHAVITCESASFYRNYNSAGGPADFIRTLGKGNKVGHTRGAHPVYNGWAATFDFGKGDWGFVRIECLGGWGSW
jgi:hypothetical protein